MLNRLCLVSVFLILFALSACRLNVGNDYAKYVEFMHLVNCNAYVPTEAGFNGIVRLIYGISGFGAKKPHEGQLPLFPVQGCQHVQRNYHQQGLVQRGSLLYIIVAVTTVLLGFLVNNHCSGIRGGVSRQQMLNGLCLVSVFLLLFALSACRLAR